VKEKICLETFPPVKYFAGEREKEWRGKKEKSGKFKSPQRGKKWGAPTLSEKNLSEIKFWNFSEIFGQIPVKEF
jgi:hypothetical protein